MKKINKILLSLVITLLLLNLYQNKEKQIIIAEDFNLDEQSATIRSIQKNIPAVVSIIVYEKRKKSITNPNTGEKEFKTRKKEKQKGTGFLISADGFIITNKHVVNSIPEEMSEFRIILNSGQQYFADLIDTDPLNDIAVLKIYGQNLPYVELGNSDNLQVGNTVIAIGNALGMYQNSATKGIVSGLGRSIEATDQIKGEVDTIDNAIQTDAEINVGNSGGPLINLNGKVIGINVATNRLGRSIGFAIPINDAKTVIKDVREFGYIAKPILGVRYIMITPELAKDFNLPREQGAWIKPSTDGSNIMKNSPADLAGLQEGDIIFEINAIPVYENSSLLSIINKYRPNDRIGLKIQRGNKVLIKIVTLADFHKFTD